jgi:hypothetical protein
MFAFDRTAHHSGTHRETELYHAKTQPETPLDRLNASQELNAAAFNYDLANPPKMERLEVWAGKLDQRNGKSI